MLTKVVGGAMPVVMCQYGIEGRDGVTFSLPSTQSGIDNVQRPQLRRRKSVGANVV